MDIEYNPKREQILLTGKELFWKFGFKRVTIEEICKEAGVSKMTYYKFFSNKIEMVKTLMDRVLKESLEKYRKITERDVPYPEKVVQMIQLKQEQVNTMSSEFFRDYVQSDDPDLINFLNQLTQENLELFTNDFKKAQEDGDIRTDLKVEFIMYMMNHLVEMAQEEALLNMYDEPQDLVMEITKFLFYGILNRDVH
ncbi:MAG: TetR/AcrR family transcriptional regulator [Bacteroidales bacterium]|nr:TetR/AcrR family transcriptional regulator [Bacteroidales bacterium]